MNPRFTVRRLMIVVALVGLLLALVAYRERIASQAHVHALKVIESSVPVPPSPVPPPGTLAVKDYQKAGMTYYRMTPEAEWHEKMSNQYSASAANISLLIVALLLVSAILVVIASVAAFLRGKRLPASTTPPEIAP